MIGIEKREIDLLTVKRKKIAVLLTSLSLISSAALANGVGDILITGCPCHLLEHFAWAFNPPQSPLIRGEALKSPLIRGDLEGLTAKK